MSAINIAIQACGGQRQLAEAVNVQIAQVWQWANDRRPIPVHLVKAIKAACNGAVGEKDLRPDDWHLIWPELNDPTHIAQPATASVAQGE